jgi:Zn-dependent peptidase ImmA (M78 family)
MNQNTTTRSTLALLRALVPQRELSFHESLRIAELQANRLLELFDVQTNAVPDEIVTDLPRVRIDRERQLPVSGAAHWNGHYWIITLNASEHRLRQRFSLMHEFKHILDHTSKDFLYRDRPGSSAHDQAERVADYFAACLLMPKRVVKRLWCQGNQDIDDLSNLLRISPAAVRYRLDQLGLIDRPRRCDVNHGRRQHFAAPTPLVIPLLQGGGR